MDAFSDLFSSSATGSSNGNVKPRTGMTLAERLARAKDSRRVEERRMDVGPQDTTWLGLDSLAHPGIGTVQRSSDQSTISRVTGNLIEKDDLGLDNFSSVSSSTPVGTSVLQPRPQQSSIKPATLWDLQDFASPTSSAQSSRPSSQPKVQQKSKLISNEFDSSGLDFDIIIQDAENPLEESRAGMGLLDGDDSAADLGLGTQTKDLLYQDPDFSADGVDSRADDDILGILSQPVEVVKAQTRTQVNFTPFCDFWISSFIPHCVRYFP